MGPIIFKTFLTLMALVAFCSAVMAIELLPDRWRDLTLRVLAGIVTLIFAAGLGYLFLSGCAEARELTAAELVVLAHDPTHRRADLNEWFKDLHSQGMPDGSQKHHCCSNQDGALVKDADWDTIKGPDGKSHYRVMINGTWYVVPDESVVTDPNKYGLAMVWGSVSWLADRAGYEIRCFMPGIMM